jgi:RNA polymerase sigma-70 factor (ECF subfamily)
MAEVDDSNLPVEQACAGSESAIAELFQHYRPRLKRLVLLRMSPRVSARLDASDVLQETYLEFARRLPEYAKHRKVPIFLWLRMLTGERLVHLQRMHLGAEKRTVYREFDLASQPMPDASVVNLASQLAGQFTSVDRNLIRDEVQRKLLDALQRMEFNDREIVAMRHFEELTTEEIAEVLGLTRSGVLKRYTRAIHRLRDSVIGDQDLQIG